MPSCDHPHLHRHVSVVLVQRIECFSVMVSEFPSMRLHSLFLGRHVAEPCINEGRPSLFARETCSGAPCHVAVDFRTLTVGEAELPAAVAYERGSIGAERVTRRGTAEDGVPEAANFVRCLADASHRCRVAVHGGMDANRDGSAPALVERPAAFLADFAKEEPPPRVPADHHETTCQAQDSANA